MAFDRVVGYSSLCRLFAFHTSEYGHSPSILDFSCRGRRLGIFREGFKASIASGAKMLDIQAYHPIIGLKSVFTKNSTLAEAHIKVNAARTRLKVDLQYETNRRVTCVATRRKSHIDTYHSTGD